MVHPIAVVGNEELVDELIERDEYAVSFDDDSPIELIECVEPSVIVIAADSESARDVAQRFADYRSVVGLGDGESVVNDDLGPCVIDVDGVEDVVAIADGSGR